MEMTWKLRVISILTGAKAGPTLLHRKKACYSTASSKVPGADFTR